MAEPRTLAEKIWDAHLVRRAAGEPDAADVESVGSSPILGPLLSNDEEDNDEEPQDDEDDFIKEDDAGSELDAAENLKSLTQEDRDSDEINDGPVISRVE